ncbi:MAG TPA: MarR family transcriptional regulator, partial [Acidisoma sp.]|nr:MarR family transcriptional regulator [Acidisoma sp.]
MRATEFGRQIYRVSTAWRREIDLRVRDFGLTEATWRPLLYLGRLGDRQRQTDLASALMIEDASLVRLVDALERAGFVERVEDLDDRRSKRITMTETGRAIYARVAAIHVSLAEDFLKDVSPEELDLCDAVLGRILNAIGAQPGAPAATSRQDEP